MLQLFNNLTPPPMDLLNATEDSSPCNSVPMNLLMRETDCVWRENIAIDCSVGAKKNRSKGRGSEQTEVMQARLDRRRVHGEESSVAFSRFIGVELVT